MLIKTSYNNAPLSTGYLTSSSQGTVLSYILPDVDTFNQWESWQATVDIAFLFRNLFSNHYRLYYISPAVYLYIL